MTPYILVVEDEDALATLLQYNLDKEGYRVDLCGDGSRTWWCSTGCCRASRESRSAAA